MKCLLFSLIVPITLLANTQKNTYEQLRDQLTAEADYRVQTVQTGFDREHQPLLCKLGVSSFLTGIFLPLTVQALQQNSIRLACLYSALTTFFGSYTLLKHGELKENTRILHEEMFNADRIFQDKMAHLHTRHYMNDIAKFMMTRLEELASAYMPRTVQPEEEVILETTELCHNAQPQ